jgi:hypothetical protein
MSKRSSIIPFVLLLLLFFLLLYFYLAKQPSHKWLKEGMSGLPQNLLAKYYMNT